MSVDARRLSLRRVCLMADAKRLEEWDRAAMIVATIRAVNGDKHATASTFNPYRQRAPLPKITAREMGQQWEANRTSKRAKRSSKSPRETKKL